MITAQDILTGNKQNLFGNFNQDPKGNNEIGNWLRRYAQSSGEQGAQGLALQGQLEPQREGAINALVNNSNPANMVANAQAQGQGYIRQGANQGTQDAARLAQMGFGAGAQGGAQQNALNQGVQANNSLLFQSQTPQAQSQALQNILGAIQQAPGAGLSQLLQMFSPIEQRNSANAAAHANSGLGALGGLLGAGLSMWNPSAQALTASRGAATAGGQFGNMLGTGIGSYLNQPDYSWLNGALY